MRKDSFEKTSSLDLEFLMGKIKILRGYCGDKDPNLYTGPWVLFDDVDTSKEEEMIGEAPA